MCGVDFARMMLRGGMEVVERANQSLAEFQRMRMWVEWPQEDFPRTSTQKPRRNVIAEFAAKQILRSGEKELLARRKSGDGVDWADHGAKRYRIEARSRRSILTWG